MLGPLGVHPSNYNKKVTPAPQTRTLPRSYDGYWVTSFVVGVGWSRQNTLIHTGTLNLNLLFVGQGSASTYELLGRSRDLVSRLRIGRIWGVYMAYKGYQPID